MDRGGHLAVGLLARGPAILPLDADGVPPRLGEAGVVDAGDPLGIGDRSRQDVAVKVDGLLDGDESADTDLGQALDRLNDDFDIFALLMGGDLTAASTGEGAVFTLWLPEGHRRVQAPAELADPSEANDGSRLSTRDLAAAAEPGKHT